MFKAAALLLTLALPAQSCPQAPDLQTQAPLLMAALNHQRQAHGLAALVWNENLVLAAALHACETAALGTISHQGQNGSRPAQRALAAGYPYRMIAENLGLGFRDVQQALQLWMQSPPHRANILAAEAREAGFGMALTAQGRSTWVLMLGAQR